MIELTTLIQESEDWLMGRILSYAWEQGYTRYTSTLEEAWRLSISGISASLVEEIGRGGGILELSPHHDFAGDPLGAFGILEARRHRERGVPLEMFLGLFKYYRQSYLDLVYQAGLSQDLENRCGRYIARSFDRMEIAFCSEWTRASDGGAVEELQAKNRLMTNEKNKFLTVVESMADPAILVGEDGRVLYANPSAVAIAGVDPPPGSEYYRSPRDATEENRSDDPLDPDEAPACRGRKLSDLLPWLRDSLQAFQRTRGSTHGTAEVECVLRGRRRLFHVRLSRMQDVSGKYPGTIILLSEITARKKAEERVLAREGDLREANEALRTTLRELEERNREIAQLNHMQELLQACIEENEVLHLLASTLGRLLPLASGAVHVLDPSSGRFLHAAAWGEGASRKTSFEPEACWALRRGSAHRVEDASTGVVCAHMKKRPRGGYVCVPLAAQGETIGVVHALFGPERQASPDEASRSMKQAKMQLVITCAEQASTTLANLRLRRELLERSVRDPLTGLYNRRYMEDSLAREERRARRRGSTLGLIVLDIDHFKQINDDFGHDEGDRVLRALGGLLRSQVRGEDIACRFGGEEFVLILPEISRTDLIRRADEIRRHAAEGLCVRVEGEVVRTVSVSAGVSLYPEDAPSAAEALKAADDAMYVSKRLGRDRVTPFDIRRMSLRAVQNKGEKARRSTRRPRSRQLSDGR